MRKLYKNSHIFYGNLRGKANSSLISYQNYNTVMLILRKIDEVFTKIPCSHGYFVVKLRKLWLDLLFCLLKSKIDSNRFDAVKSTISLCTKWLCLRLHSQMDNCVFYHHPSLLQKWLSVRKNYQNPPPPIPPNHPTSTNVPPIQRA